MNTTLEALLAQRHKLDRQIAELRTIERATAIIEVRALVGHLTTASASAFLSQQWSRSQGELHLLSEGNAGLIAK